MSDVLSASTAASSTVWRYCRLSADRRRSERVILQRCRSHGPPMSTIPTPRTAEVCGGRRSATHSDPLNFKVANSVQRKKIRTWTNDGAEIYVSMFATEQSGALTGIVKPKHSVCIFVNSKHSWWRNSLIIALPAAILRPHFCSHPLRLCGPKLQSSAHLWWTVKPRDSANRHGPIGDSECGAGEQWS